MMIVCKVDASGKGDHVVSIILWKKSAIVELTLI